MINEGDLFIRSSLSGKFFSLSKTFSKISKIFQKPIDKPPLLCYTIFARGREGLICWLSFPSNLPLKNFFRKF